MKTKLNSTLKSVSFTKKALIVLLALVLNSVSMHSQTENNKFGVGLSSTVGGCGFGTIYNPSVHFYHGPFRMELAASIQKRKLNLTGAQFTFEYAIFDGCNRAADKLAMQGFQLFLFSATNYNQGAYLGKSQLRTERRVADDAQIDFDALRYNTIDVTIGFGNRIQLTKKIKWVNSIGFSGWQTLKGERATYREYASFSLKLKSGLTYDF